MNQNEKQHTKSLERQGAQPPQKTAAIPLKTGGPTPEQLQKALSILTPKRTEREHQIEAHKVNVEAILTEITENHETMRAFPNMGVHQMDVLLIRLGELSNELKTARANYLALFNNQESEKKQ